MVSSSSPSLLAIAVAIKATLFEWIEDGHVPELNQAGQRRNDVLHVPGEFLVEAPEFLVLLRDVDGLLLDVQLQLVTPFLQLCSLFRREGPQVLVLLDHLVLVHRASDH